MPSSLPPRIAPGERIYAIGDVHGRLGLFAALIARIRSDVEQRPPAKTRLLLMGDIVDRGPDTAMLIERLRGFQASGMDITVLKGSHEQMMLAALRGLGDPEAYRRWMGFGGKETLRSWGLESALFAQPEDEQLRAAQAAIPDRILDWLEWLPHSFKSGDFFFAHAGMSPADPLTRQHQPSLTWIGRGYLEQGEGHPAPVEKQSRVALDAGSWKSGKLTAVGFEEDLQWTITT